MCHVCFGSKNSENVLFRSIIISLENSVSTWPLIRSFYNYRIYSINRPGRLLNFWTLKVGANSRSRWALIRGRALIRINTVCVEDYLVTTLSFAVWMILRRANNTPPPCPTLTVDVIRCTEYQNTDRCSLPISPLSRFSPFHLPIPFFYFRLCATQADPRAHRFLCPR